MIPNLMVWPPALRPVIGVVLLLLLAGSYALPAQAHGASIAYTTATAVEIIATFDSGEPMAEAQVSVYAPTAPQTPWLTGVTDENGRFVFNPDPALPGSWDVQVRQAGHGAVIQVPVGEAGSATGSSGFTTPQLLLMGASVIWGLIGTALYFSRRQV